MLDRIDIHIEVPRVDFEKLSDNRRGESSDEIRARVEQARQRQRARFAGLNNGVITNADMRVAEVRQFCELDEAGQMLIKAAMAQLQRDISPKLPRFLAILNQSNLTSRCEESLCHRRGWVRLHRQR